jgi:hypothetical protein
METTKFKQIVTEAIGHDFDDWEELTSIELVFVLNACNQELGKEKSIFDLIEVKTLKEACDLFV